MTRLVRAARWPHDFAALRGLDTSFTTDRIYRVERRELGFALVEESVDPPLRKDHGRALDEDELRGMSYAVVAEDEGEAVGFAAAEHEAWNGRVIVRHLYVAASHRGRGIGRALVQEMEAFARRVGGRSLWVETPNVNVPAIRFYRRMGFRLCGLDDSLYGPGGGETALFFVRELE